ncbi:hypothetical protein ACFL96_05555 [Thermoproteota archaeon]
MIILKVVSSGESSELCQNTRAQPNVFTRFLATVLFTLAKNPALITGLLLILTIPGVKADCQDPELYQNPCDAWNKTSNTWMPDVYTQSMRDCYMMNCLFQHTTSAASRIRPSLLITLIPIFLAVFNSFLSAFGRK